ncbi:hypothetical protein M2152_001028 [Microbacteriaceae bacterium SG_E_30_P1]|uniref:Uncharacterized protein n=1 Tax=Antiquaquibacter oligotrophicus TaxID=2880260 RepID=A0ABT6KLE3_9MICO|nr:hypothetical protein [Antiquaquibacter oligotrophicus]
MQKLTALAVGEAGSAGAAHPATIAPTSMASVAL